MPTTTNFGWTTPTEDGSPGTWDTILNTAFQAIDTNLQTVKTTADAALPKAGGTMTGNLGGLTADWTVVNKGNMTGAVELDLATSDYFYGVRTGLVTLTFANWPASGRVEYVVFEVDNNNVAGMTFPAAVLWDTLVTAPNIHPTDTQVFLFWSRDAGTTIRGKLLYQRSS